MYAILACAIDMLKGSNDELFICSDSKKAIKVLFTEESTYKLVYECKENIRPFYVFRVIKMKCGWIGTFGHNQLSVGPEPIRVAWPS